MTPQRRKFEKLQREFIFKSEVPFERVEKDEFYGAGHILNQADEIADILKNFELYRKAHVSFGGGALFLGPHGTGKTMTARYVATQSGARFVDVRKFPVPKLTGTHTWQPQDVACLFRFSEEWAQKNKRPIVLFIDQFDDWLDVHGNVASQLEMEIDGFSGRKQGVYFIVTAKDKPKKSSLFRGKRIDKEIHFSFADKTQKMALFGGFLGRYPHEEKISVKNLVYLIVKSSPADIKAIVDEAYQVCVRKENIKKARGGKVRKPIIDNEILIEVLLAKATGNETGHFLSPDVERNTAIHEVGHYVVGRALGLPAQFIAVMPMEKILGEAIGEVFLSDADELRDEEIEERRSSIAINLASIYAEKLFGLSPRVGSEGDLENATWLAKGLLYRTCNPRPRSLRPYGLMRFEMAEEDYKPVVSDKLADKLELAVGKILTEEGKKCEKILRFFGKKYLERVVDVLLKKPHKLMLQSEVDQLLQPKLSRYHKMHKIKDLLRAN